MMEKKILKVDGVAEELKELGTVSDAFIAELRLRDLQCLEATLSNSVRIEDYETAIYCRDQLKAINYKK